MLCNPGQALEESTVFPKWKLLDWTTTCEIWLGFQAIFLVMNACDDLEVVDGSLEKRVPPACAL